MKEHWERLTDHLALDLPRLTALIEPLLPGRAVAAATLLTGGQANTLYRVDVAGVAPLVLRLYTRDAAACAKDVALWQLLHEQIPLPKLHYADVDGAALGVPYTINSWVTGQSLADLVRTGAPDDVAAAMFAAGRVLAELGRVRFAESGFFGPDLDVVQPLVWNGAALRWFVDDALWTRAGAERVGQPFAERLAAFVDRHADLLDDLPETIALVHADYNPPNIMVARRDAAWEVAAVLDWEFAFAGPPLYDIGVLLRGAYRQPSKYAAQVVAGYAANGGALLPGWQQQSRLLDLFNLLDFVVKAQPGTEMLRDVTQLLDETMQHWEPPGTAR